MLAARTMRFALTMASMTMIMGIAGCRDSGASLVGVTGVVTYKGKELDTGAVEFVSESGRGASGEIVNGQITDVTTYTRGDGIAPGEYRVAIISLDRSGEHRNSMTAPSKIPQEYGDAASSGLNASIESGKPNELRFDLQ